MHINIYATQQSKVRKKIYNILFALFFMFQQNTQAFNVEAIMLHCLKPLFC